MFAVFLVSVLLINLFVELLSTFGNIKMTCGSIIQALCVKGACLDVICFSTDSVLLHFKAFFKNSNFQLIFAKFIL